MSYSDNKMSMGKLHTYISSTNIFLNPSELYTFFLIVEIYILKHLSFIFDVHCIPYLK